MTSSLQVDVAVVGAGAAGLYAAIVAARAGARVALVSRSPLAESASYWAQGGIAAAIAEGDSAELHARDTLAAGRAAGRTSAVRALCEGSPEVVRDLESLGVRFDASRNGALALGLEGGHGRRRVVHAGGSATGRRITRALSGLVARHERIEVLEGTTASSLWVEQERCVGLVSERSDGTLMALKAGATVLATGGAAALWERTTNPRGVIGAGLSLAATGGAVLADLEFVQFHPTALVSDSALDGFLITEAIRGEGALLVDAHGERFVDELAPRDEVALAIDSRQAVSLDMRHVELSHFPNVATTLAQAGLDPRRDLVPVAPAAHYTMGGVATDLDGRSSLEGLFAVGECACSGLHGANRLASNSLAECFVFGRRAGVAAAATEAGEPTTPPPGRGESPVPPRGTRTALWRGAGIRRDRESLELLSRDSFALARGIATAALAREESRGAHQRRDFPRTDPSLDGRHSVVQGDGVPSFEYWD